VIEVMHIIAGLETDGAETVLHRLTSHMDPERFSNEVISLTTVGPMAPRLEASGVRVRALGMKPGIPNPYYVARLASWLRFAKPQVVQTWMYHADLLGGVAAKLAGNIPVVWGIHHTNLDHGQNKRLTIWTARACAALSRRIPSRIVCCSQASLEVHARFGYAAQKMEVIPNGFDTRQFHPDPEARAVVRRELGLSESSPVIGMAARFHPQKGHRTFVKAAALLHAQNANVHFLLCGKGVDRQNAELVGWIEEAGLTQVCHLLGPLEDMPRFFATLDVATSSSLTEAFPVAVGEAMACGIPCAVTDVGDSAAIVGDAGRVVPANDPIALASAWQSLLNAGPEQRQQLGLAARHRVEQKYALQDIVERYEEVYRQAAGASSVPGAEPSKLASLAG
jgi:glycosyltransferase involved in cell wall biosynthesis